HAAGVISLRCGGGSKSLAPSRRSSAWIRRPTVVCLVLSCVAAALKLPVLATARKNLTSSQSPRILGTLLLRGGVETIVTIDTMCWRPKHLLTGGLCGLSYTIAEGMSFSVSFVGH